MKFRKKPVVVEATQWTPNSHASAFVLADGTSMAVDWRAKTLAETNRQPRLWVLTPTGMVRACPGDWIITGVKGEHYPCKPDIFAATYEKVGESQ